MHLGNHHDHRHGLYKRGDCVIAKLRSMTRLLGNVPPRKPPRPPPRLPNAILLYLLGKGGKN